LDPRFCPEYNWRGLQDSHTGNRRFSRILSMNFSNFNNVWFRPIPSKILNFYNFPLMSYHLHTITLLFYVSFFKLPHPLHIHPETIFSTDSVPPHRHPIRLCASSDLGPSSNSFVDGSNSRFHISSLALFFKVYRIILN